MDTEFNPTPGVAELVAPGIRRVLAPNPSPMTFRGTNTYLLGKGDVAVIDPGPDMNAHLAAILAALTPGERISHILVTHSHVDHSALVPRLKAVTGAPVYAYGNSLAGRDAAIAALPGVGGGEGIDAGFAPDHLLADGAYLAGGSWQVQAIWTPGHMGNHLCFAHEDRLFSGDHVMGWASSMVSPPDGDLTAFMTSLEKLQGRGHAVYFPAHGAKVTSPEARLAELLTHRRGREAQILAALSDGPATPSDLTARLYTDVPRALWPAAERNVMAHLIDLSRRKIVSNQGDTGTLTAFHLT